MADAVRTIVTHVQAPYYAVNLTNISDGTGESGVVKIDKSNLLATNGQEPHAIDIMFCWGSVFGANHVHLFWDNAAAETALVLNGPFFFDYSHVRGLKPQTSGGTGDLRLTTSGLVANGGYCIDLMCLLREKQ